MQSRIVDMHGQPFELDLEVQQTEDEARVQQLLKRYSDNPTQGLTPKKLAQLMKRVEQGDLSALADLATDMEDKDSHLIAELGKRRRAVRSLSWIIKPPRNATDQEKKDAALITELLEDATWFNDLLFDMTDGILKSFSMSELRWEYVEKTHMISGAEYREQGLFQLGKENRNELRLRSDDPSGTALNPFGWVAHISRSKSGYLHRAGLTSNLAWPFLFKNYSIRDLAEFLEIYGLPSKIGKYPAGASGKEKSTLMRAVLSIGHNAGGIIPKGMEIDFKEAAKGQADPFLNFVAWCEKAQSKALLGGTLTGQADGATSTNALGRVHQDVMDDIIESDAMELAATITRDIVYPLYALNGRSYSGPRRMPRFEFDLSEPEDIKLYSDSVPNLVDVGMPIPVRWLQDKLQIPAVENDEPVLGRVMAIAPVDTATLKTQTAALKAEEPEQEDLDVLEARLQQVASPLMDKLLEPVKQAVLKAKSLEELRSNIIALAGELNTSELGAQMQLAIAASTLLGRAEVDDGR
ncbi:DUF935 domain-containing protein [Pseudoalteromonas luteoviolacea]|uniref:DUF935 domain-containing protein n=1 Tax=Pseudoalteromonas luteoviolacea TaxID=43657 RepID=UPI001151230D|nr:DUF935 domain-containing protein [Pseudoalteromonas luteoviolacea]TQF69560.1 DUF935 domain-containing protein [Pseudoalteromonas luteoviolacea]